MYVNMAWMVCVHVCNVCKCMYVVYILYVRYVSYVMYWINQTYVRYGFFVLCMCARYVGNVRCRYVMYVCMCARYAMYVRRYVMYVCFSCMYATQVCVQGVQCVFLY